ncbi:serine/threonine-protein kinase [Streptomyces sp. Z26]|uniref:serine/threonine-protein kinase n=1 Tax=Streptomyces sp. Z26 TaxID=2500177 RepID=UPI001404F95A|nr:serine/threonine-protein kinase [Streptomyces sp. Z26]
MEALDGTDPRRVGGYRVLARLGSGGSAVVYLGRSRGGLAVAVKVAHAARASDADFRERFRAEVSATRAAGGTYGPAVLDAAPDAEPPWLATEFLPSLSLREAVERFGPLPGGTVLRLAAGLAEGLDQLHRRGIAHLDVNPANVLLTATGPRLVDFGSAAVAGPGAGPGAGPAARARQVRPGARSGRGGQAAPVGTHAGTWDYMSPEQVAGDAWTPSDIHSLGATLHHALTAQPPPPFGTAAPGGPETPRALRDVLAACSRPDPEVRPTAAELTVRLAAAWEAAPAPPFSPPGAEWLPRAVAAAIEAEAVAAADPPPPRPPVHPVPPAPTPAPAPAPAPAPPPPPPPRAGAGVRPGRRALLVAAASALAASAAVLARRLPHPWTDPSGPAEPPYVELEFVITGDAPLASLAYAVDGRFTRLEDVPLPWRRTFRVRGGARAAEWRLRLRLDSGRIRYRVLVDGVRTRDESHPPGPTSGYPYDVDKDGLATEEDAVRPGPLAGRAG